MKNTFKLTSLLALTLLITIFSCSEDDAAIINNVISVQDLTTVIDENPTVGQIVGTVVTTQTVGGGTINYSIDSQTPVGALSINATTGEVTVADTTLFDFEENPVLTAVVSVSGAVNTATVTVNLNNVSELNIQDFTTAIDENPTNGDVVGTVQATGDGTLAYSITSQTPTGALNIDAVTGELSVADATLFDYETNPTITASILVDNSGTSDTLTLTINLNNVNELSIQDFTTAINENPTNGDVIGTVQAVGDGTLTYSITSQTPTGALSINVSTGELTVTDATIFDFETTPTITANISVDNTVSTETAVATINLNNINELGDYNHGGIIFWLDPADNSHGLVFAFNNQLSNLQWGCSGTTTGANGTAIGTGEANTTTIVSVGCGIGGAAEVISNLSANGYNDWFLPSVDEWNEIEINYSSILWPAIQANGGSGLNNTNWTSTEDSDSNVYVHLFGGGASSYPKSLTINALPVRAF